MNKVLAPLTSRAIFTTVMIIIIIPTIYIISSYKIASAHEELVLGNISVTAGWGIEPPLKGQINSVELQIIKNNGSQPVRNALANLEINIRFGGVTKSLAFLPDQNDPAKYISQLIPSRPGSYSIVLKGQIEGHRVDSEMQLESVQDSQKLAFPPSSDVAGSEIQLSQITERFKNVLSDISTQIKNTNTTASTAQKIADQSLKALDTIKQSADRANILAMIGVGTGIAGILIAAVALSRKPL